MQVLQLPLKKLKIDGEEFLEWLDKIPEPERKKYSPEFFATLFVVENVLEAYYGG
ncbi:MULTISPECIES: hypothetical protein [unclassified Archaeoglobus]|uniref:hypothetical protein n=1 Tax=unclassified Archaeoglobus TaxID=2643606 RepID=UPI0025C58691|nr:MULTISPECIES: hypothetical protein [unclassified Archaeoglobus]